MDGRQLQQHHQQQQQKQRKKIENCQTILKQMGLLYLDFMCICGKVISLEHNQQKKNPLHSPPLYSSFYIFFLLKNSDNNAKTKNNGNSYSNSSTNWSIIDFEIKIFYVNAMVSIYLFESTFFSLFFLFQCKQLSAMQGNPINVISLYYPCPILDIAMASDIDILLEEGEREIKIA